jgi:hypothetical protein
MNEPIMVDLETMSSESNASIISIGAVRFTLDDILPNPFYTAVSLEGQKELGLDISASTVTWWMGQSDAARSVMSDKNKLMLANALERFAMWVSPGTDGIWGNGSDFDCVILVNAYKAIGMTAPWKFSKHRCYRTLKNEAKLRPGVELPPREGTHHNALDDAIYQAKCAQVYLKEMHRE